MGVHLISIVGGTNQLVGVFISPRASKAMSAPSSNWNSAQGALEYLLLIGGGVLVSIVILLIIFSSSSTSENFLGNSIGTYQNNINLNPGNGGQIPGPGGDSTPPTISFTITPGDFSMTIVYTVSDSTGSQFDAGIASVVLVKTNSGGIWHPNKNNFSFYDSPPPGAINSVIPVVGNPLQFSGVFLDEGVSNDTHYFYGMKACDAVGNCFIRYLSGPTPSPRGPVVDITFSSSEEIIFHGDDSSPQALGDNCTPYDVIDLPFRAFKNSAGDTIAIGSSDASNSTPNNFVWQLPGNDWSASNFIRRCDRPFTVNAPLGPNQNFPLWDKHWLASPYNDGSGIYAQIHNEWHDLAHYSPVDYCYAFSAACDYFSISWAESMDDGYSFSNALYSPSAGGHVMAAVPKPWDAASDALGGAPNYGVSSSSNILDGGDGYYYSIFGVIHQSGSASERGTCVARTDDLSDPKRWRFLQFQNIPNMSKIGPSGAILNHTGLLMGPRSSWNLAQLFSTQMNNANGDPALECSFLRDISPNLPESLVYSNFLHKYVLLFANNFGACDFSYSLSPDLIHWSAPKLLRDNTLFASPFGGNWPSSCEGIGPVYPSIIDPDSPGLNYEKMDNRAFLYWLQGNNNPSGGPANYVDVDEVRQEIIFSCPNSDC